MTGLPPCAPGLLGRGLGLDRRRLFGHRLRVGLHQPLGRELTSIRDHGDDGGVVGLEPKLDDPETVDQVAGVEHVALGLQPLEEPPGGTDRRRVVEIQQADLELTVDDRVTDAPLGIVGRPPTDDGSHRREAATVDPLVEDRGEPGRQVLRAETERES